MNREILLVEDDEFLRDGLSEMLQKEGYQVKCASNIDSAKKMLLSFNFSLIVLDVMLPDGNGFDLCRYLRTGNSNVPILFLTACDDEIQIVRGLDIGADDYVTKPFKLHELMSRVRALLRRNTIFIYNSGDIAIDTSNMTVKLNGKNVFLTPTEYQILSVLVRNNGGIITRNMLLEIIWDDSGTFIDDNTLSVHISRLRDKIGANHIQTIRGIGYRWEDVNDSH